MLIKTKGIVLRQIKFSDSGVIVKVFTQENGVQSYFVRGLNSKKSKNKSALYQPLSILNLVTKYSEKKTLHNINDAEFHYKYRSLNDNMKKRSLLIFVNELLYKCLQEETGDTILFNWVYNSLVWLDMKENDYANFHLLFILHLSKFMGFFPVDKAHNNEPVFDLMEGQFITNVPMHSNYITGEVASAIYNIHLSTYDSMSSIKINRDLRNTMLETLISYYNFHMPQMGEFKSLDILKVVLS